MAWLEHKHTHTHVQRPVAWCVNLLA